VVFETPLSWVTLSSATFKSNSRRGLARFCAVAAIAKFASEAILSPLEFSLSGVRRGSAGRKALVAAEPFHPRSPLILKGLAGGINAPLVAARTAIGAATPLAEAPEAMGWTKIEVTETGGAAAASS
jgi:hypothetical protein